MRHNEHVFREDYDIKTGKVWDGLTGLNVPYKYINFTKSYGQQKLVTYL